MAEPFQAVYIGKRIGANGVRFAWAILGEDRKHTDNLILFAKSKRGDKSIFVNSWVGDVYNFERTTDNRNTILAKDRVGQYEDDAQRRIWQLEDRAADTQVEHDRRAAKQGFGEMTLDELAEAYRKTIGSAKRAAIVAAVIQHVTK